jgi:DNA-binding NarL/FixJ family response regulator
LEESIRWKIKSKKYLDGLSHSIDEQLTVWELTKSEKEVAFLLLKGFSFKEIGEARGTAEKTARSQSAVVYSKASLSNRSQLSAFFLEDLLLPN